MVERKSSKKEKSAARFIAFPPDGDFELYTLSERGYSTVEATASAAFSEAGAATTRTGEEEQAKVAEELATQSLQECRRGCGTRARGRRPGRVACHFCRRA